LKEINQKLVIRSCLFVPGKTFEIFKPIQKTEAMRQLSLESVFSLIVNYRLLSVNHFRGYLFAMSFCFSFYHEGILMLRKESFINYLNCQWLMTIRR